MLVDRHLHLGSVGSVLIAVLLIMSALLSMILLMGENVSNRYENVSEMADEMQGYIYCDTAIKDVMKILKEDDNHYDAPDELWAVLAPVSTPDGSISVSIIPLNSRIPLLPLISKDKKLKNRVSESLERFKPDIDIDSFIKKLSKNIPYSIRELRYSPVFKDEKFDINLLKYYTVEDTEGKININFASPDVIKAFLPELETYIDDILAYRKASPFKDISDLRKIPGITNDLYLKVQPYITVNSNYFCIYVAANANGFNSTACAIVKRNGRNVKLLKYFENVKNYYASK